MQGFFSREDIILDFSAKGEYIHSVEQGVRALKEKIIPYIRSAGVFIGAFGKWVGIAAVVGLIGGLIGSAFHLSVDYATGLRNQNTWLLWLLPLAGLVIVWAYKFTGTEGKGTNAVIGSILGAFPGEGIRGKVQQGAAWWFNNTQSGIEAQLTSLAGLGLLGTTVGTVTDSRSLFSFPRHEYYRRILCNFIGGLVERGEYPDDEKQLAQLVEDICYGNAARFIGIDKNQ